MLFPGGGPPDDAAWRQAMEDDQHNSPDVLVDQTLREAYADDAHLREDWANSVARLLENDRADEGFRRRYENRARIIDDVLATGGSTG
jgi:hypothetical protein